MFLVSCGNFGKNEVQQKAKQKPTEAFYEVSTETTYLQKEIPENEEDKGTMVFAGDILTVNIEENKDKSQKNKIFAHYTNPYGYEYSGFIDTNNVEKISLKEKKEKEKKMKEESKKIVSGNCQRDYDFFDPYVDDYRRFRFVFKGECKEQAQIPKIKQRKMIFDYEHLFRSDKGNEWGVNLWELSFLTNTREPSYFKFEEENYKTIFKSNGYTIRVYGGVEEVFQGIYEEPTSENSVKAYISNGPRAIVLSTFLKNKEDMKHEFDDIVWTLKNGFQEIPTQKVPKIDFSTLSLPHIQMPLIFHPFFHGPEDSSEGSKFHIILDGERTTRKIETIKDGYIFWRSEEGEKNTLYKTRMFDNITEEVREEVKEEVKQEKKNINLKYYSLSDIKLEGYKKKYKYDTIDIINITATIGGQEVNLGEDNEKNNLIGQPLEYMCAGKEISGYRFYGCYPQKILSSTEFIWSGEYGQVGVSSDWYDKNITPDYHRCTFKSNIQTHTTSFIRCQKIELKDLKEM